MVHPENEYLQVVKGQYLSGVNSTGGFQSYIKKGFPGECISIQTDISVADFM